MAAGWREKVHGGGKRAGLTVKVTLAGNGETPASVLGQGVEHVVEEADAGVDVDDLALAGLLGVVVTGGEEAGVGIRGEVTTVEVEGELDLGLVGVAGDAGPARFRGSHCGGWDEGVEGVGGWWGSWRGLRV